MRVLTLSTIYPNEVADSEGRSVAFLDQELAQIGVQGVTLVLRPGAPAWLARKFKRWRHLAVSSRIERREGTTVVFDRYVHIPRRYRLDLSARFMTERARSLIKKHGWGFDLIHGQSIYPAALAACSLAREYNVLFAITLRDDLNHLDDMLARGSAQLRQQYQEMFASVGAIFVHGPGILNDAPKYLPKGRSIPVLMAPNGVDVTGIESILASLSAPQAHPWGRIVSVSNLYRMKGIHENLQALSLLDGQGLREWQYTVVGDGPYLKELVSLVAELGLQDRVSFVGKVPHREAIQWIRDSDIFCLPSWKEPFGNVFAEAAVCVKPVIGCRATGAEITVKHGETGFLVAPGDVQTLADSLGYALRHPSELQRMGTAASRHVRQFTWSQTAQTYKRIFEQLSGAVDTPVEPTHEIVVRNG